MHIIMHKRMLSNYLIFSKIVSNICLLNPINKLYETPREIQLLENFYRNHSEKLRERDREIKLMDELFYAR
jgi:hypothetical protein